MLLLTFNPHSTCILGASMHLKETAKDRAQALLTTLWLELAMELIRLELSLPSSETHGELAGVKVAISE